MSDAHVDDVVRTVLQQVQPTAVEPRPLLDALGAVAAQAICSPRSVPPAAVSAMDGFAVRSRDTAGAPVELRVVGVAAAGQPVVLGLRDDEAVRILTGAVVPPGADAVVRAERARRTDDLVVVTAAVEAGEDVRPAGDAVRRGDELVDRGDTLGPAHLALLASVGIAEAKVHRAPLVGVVSTGDELVEPGLEPQPWQVHDSNATLLAALVRSAGAAVERRHCGDDATDLAAVVDELADGCDLVLTTGGVSMGQEYDVVVTFACERGLEVARLAVKPGRPLVHGTVDRTPFIGLPGNPVAAAVLFEVLVHPVLRRLAGRPALPPVVGGVAASTIGQRDTTRVQFVRVRQRHDGRWEATEGQGSHQLRGLAAADALARIEPGRGPTRAGEELSLIDLRR